MNMFSNFKIEKKLALLATASVLELACIAGLALWALSDSTAAADKTQRYAHKLNLAEQIDVNLSELALNVASLPSSKHVSRDVEGVMALRKQLAAKIEFLKANATTDEDRGLLRKIDEAVAPWRDYNNQVIQSIQASKQVDAAKCAADQIAQFTAVTAAVDTYKEYRQRRMDLFQGEELATVSRAKLWMITLSLLFVMVAVLLNWLTTRSIAGPLGAAVDQLDQIAGGDLTQDVAARYLDRGDEIGMLSRTMQTMSRSLRDVLQEMTGGIYVVSSSSTELSANSGQMSDGAREASSTAHSVAAAAEQMASNVVSVAAGMEQTSVNLASVASATEQMTSTIGEIAKNSEKARRITEEATRQAGRISEQMNELGQAAREIGKVTETITEISSQTNLLALNATIEAARAGSAGKGFAVVANEIKELAQQTAAATEDIKARIAGVQSSSAGGISEIEKVTHVIQEVSEIVSTIAAAIEEQATVTRNIAMNVGEASTGVQDANQRVSESAHATQEIAKEIASVDQAARHMAEGSEQVRVSAGELSQVAEQLQATSSRFRVAKGTFAERESAVAAHASSVDLSMLQNALQAHSAWRGRLKTATVSGKLDLPVASVKADDQCQFGKWLYGPELPALEKQSDQYRKVKNLHAQFHQEAAKVAQMAVSGQQAAAEKALGLSSDFSKASYALMDAVKSWGKI